MMNTPSGAKEHHESTKSESHQTAKIFLFSSSDRLVQICILFHDFCTKQQIFHRVLHQPITFFQVWSLTRQFELLTEELWLPLWRHFSSHVHMHRKDGNKVYLHKVADLEIQLMCRECLKTARSGKWFSQYCIGGQTCCSVRDGKLQFKHASAAKRSDMLDSR